MSKEYIKQLEAANAELTERLEAEMDKHEKFCNDKFELKKRLDYLNINGLKKSTLKTLAQNWVMKGSL